MSSAVVLSGPFGLAFNSADELFVSNASFRNTTILKFTPDGVGSLFAITNLTGPAIFSPKGLAVDSTGNLYVAQSEIIEKITPQGIGSVFVDRNHAGSSLGFNPDWIVIAPDAAVAPLPAVFQMGVLLFCCMGIVSTLRSASRNRTQAN